MSVGTDEPFQWLKLGASDTAPPELEEDGCIGPK
jgi:hypothetical protein